MKVLVTGSYRLHEREHGFVPGRWDDFRAAARALGFSLAKERHDILLQWSHNNLRSQLGIKNNKSLHPRSHPYWETADYHVLMGYLACLEQHPEKAREGSVVLTVLGRDEDYPNAEPFCNPNRLTALMEPFRSDDPNEVLPEPFDPSEWRPISDFIQSRVVDLQILGNCSNEMRQMMLKQLVAKADPVIILGGGKATGEAAASAAKSKKLIALAPFCDGGAISAIEAEAVRDLRNLATAVEAIAASLNGDLLKVAAAVPSMLSSLSRAERAPKIVVITMRSDEYRGVQVHLKQRSEWQGCNRTYDIGLLHHFKGSPLRVGLVLAPEQGEEASQKTTNDVIEDTKPDLIILCGVAGALPSPDLTLGDVVVSNRLHNFGTGSENASGEREFGNQGGPLTPEVEDMVARIFALDGNGKFGDWSDEARIGRPQPGLLAGKLTFLSAPAKTVFKNHFFLPKGKGNVYRRKVTSKVLVGGVGGNGDLLKNPALVEQMRQSARSLVALQMEFAGAYVASRKSSKTYNLLTIRGISDIIGMKRDDAWTEYAALIAGSFCCKFIEALPERFLAKLIDGTH